MTLLTPQDKTAAEVAYDKVALSALPHATAVQFVRDIYAPGERFEQGFYRYWRLVQNMSEAEAREATRQELQEYADKLIANLADPAYHTVGFDEAGVFKPVALYSLRPLVAHESGQKLHRQLQETGALSDYPGKLALAHSYSALNGFRSLRLLKHVFLHIALEAIAEDYAHIFFFMSDHRLGPIYRRFGLEFPASLKFSDSKHLVGFYRMSPEHIALARSLAREFQVPLPV